METIQHLHGNPKIIVSDRDPIFTRNFWMELFSCLGTQLADNSSYHPQSDGKIEIVKKCLEGYRRCFVYDKNKIMGEVVTPFMILYGYHPPFITSNLR